MDSPTKQWLEEYDLGDLYPMFQEHKLNGDMDVLKELSGSDQEDVLRTVTDSLGVKLKLKRAMTRLR